MEGKNKISVLILTHNRLGAVKKCFDSIKKIIEREDIFELLILDNASTDGTTEFIKKFAASQKKIKITFSEKNTGCAGGRDFLLKIASGNKILLLDSDVIINSAEFIDKLVLALKKPGVGIAGMHGKNLNQDTMDFQEPPDYFEGIVDYVSGFCQMFDKNVLERGCRIDMFYNPYYAEDADFCFQIKEKIGLAAYKLKEDGDIIHKWGQTNLGTEFENKKKFEYLFKKFNLYPKEAEKIPKIIHQTWKTSDIPYSIYNERWVQSWKNLNPEWEYKLWTDQDNREFIKENYPWFLKIYDSYPQGIQRADAVRYFILYHFGGLYVDLDFECLKNIDPLLENKTLVFGRVYPTKEGFNEIPNAFMASTQKNKFWVRIFIELIKQKDCAEVEYSTGPVMLTNTVTENCIETKKYQVEIIPPELIYPVSWEKEALCLNNVSEETLNIPQKKYPDAYAITYWAHNWGDKFNKKNENDLKKYSNEIEHWKKWLAEKNNNDKDSRLDPCKEFIFPELLQKFSEKNINVLDVGSGPIASIGYCHKDYKINIFPTDILAEEYTKIMKEEKITAPIPTMAIAGEFLDNYFPKLFFHISIAGNSLDHSENPILILKKMEKLTKTGGFIVLGHYYNEGEYENYSGIHGWNFYINENKPFLCNKDKSENYDLNKIFSDCLDLVRLDWANKNPKERGFITIIYKKKDDNEEMKRRFKDIYKNNLWLNGSGPGSLPENTVEYRDFLQNFLKEEKIKSVLDLGCGDWQFSKLIDWSGIEYVGYDIVKSVVEENERQYSKENIHFYYRNFLDSDLPNADLIIIKDVLQHLSTKNILKTIDKIKKYKYAILVNDFSEINNDCKNGDWRPLNFNAHPFKLNAKEVLFYRGKKVFLLCGNIDEVAIIFLGTGEYLNYFPKYYQTVKDLFLPNTNKTFFVFTDNTESAFLKDKKDIIPVFIPNENWPFPTLFRFKYINSVSEKLKRFSHIIYIDADTYVHSLISENEFFCHDKPLFGVRHPGFVQALGSFEFDKKSLAAVDKNDDLSVYWQGCFWGGKTDYVLKLANELKKRCEIDLSKNVVAIWHDESHLNKYFIENKKDVYTYHPGFAFTENHVLWEIDPVYSKIKYPKKIIHVNKRCEIARQKD